MHKVHPLKLLYASTHKQVQPKEDFSFNDSQVLSKKQLSERIKRFIGYHLYPLLNKIQRKRILKELSSIEGFDDTVRVPNILGIGHKGFGQEIFLRRISKYMNPKPSVVICYGCGKGDEIVNIARYLRPDHIIGIDYFNFTSYWNLLKETVSNRYKIKVDFFQLDYDIPNEKLLGTADLVYSHAVLEHLIDMEKVYPVLKSFLKPSGYFSAQWGPMWNSYSGDHISGELGLENGFRHLQLPTHEYVKYYKNHPRNRNTVAKGQLTWLEMGLHNFAIYAKYMESLRAVFGEIIYLQWVVSDEALKFKKLYNEEWKAILKEQSELTELDLVVQCAGILLKPLKSYNVQ